MIKRVSIEIIDHGLSNFESPDKAVFAREYYNNFIRAAKKQGLCWEFLENISMYCDTCHSFIIGLIELYDFIEQLLEFPDFNDSFGVMRRCNEHLGERYLYYLDDSLADDLPEVAVIFDKHCSCNHMFVGETEEESGQIDFGMPSGRVMKYIGPRRYWS
jgi:hypothetical protein